MALKTFKADSEVLERVTRQARDKKIFVSAYISTILKSHMDKIDKRKQSLKK